MSTKITTKTKLVPAPKKSEIIEAMAIIERDKLLESQPKTIERFNKADKAIDNWFNKNAKKLIKFSEFSHYSSGGTDRVRISFDVKKEDFPVQLKKLQDEYNESSRSRVYPIDIPSLSEIKSQIRNKLNGCPEDRVRSLVDDPEFRKTAQAALEAASK